MNAPLSVQRIPMGLGSCAGAAREWGAVLSLSPEWGAPQSNDVTESSGDGMMSKVLSTSSEIPGDRGFRGPKHGVWG